VGYRTPETLEQAWLDYEQIRKLFEQTWGNASEDEKEAWSETRKNKYPPLDEAWAVSNIDNRNDVKHARNTLEWTSHFTGTSGQRKHACAKESIYYTEDDDGQGRMVIFDEYKAEYPVNFCPICGEESLKKENNL